jgi:hypothetical protein
MALVRIESESIQYLWEEELIRDENGTSKNTERGTEKLTTCLYCSNTVSRERIVFGQKLTYKIKYMFYTYETYSNSFENVSKKDIPSSLVKISFVTAQRLYLSRSFKQSCSIRAVLPLPTGPPIPTTVIRSSVCT